MATPRTGRPHGGTRAGAGRPKGARTKTYRPHVEKILAAGPGMLPKDVLLDVMRRHYRARRYDEAARVAALVAPYVHPRLSCSAVAVNRSLAEQIAEMSDEELAAHIEEMKQMTGLSDDDLEDELTTLKTRGNA